MLIEGSIVAKKLFISSFVISFFHGSDSGSAKATSYGSYVSVSGSGSATLVIGN
jgi:hypothetical protein